MAKSKPNQSEVRWKREVDTLLLFRLTDGLEEDALVELQLFLQQEVFLAPRCEKRRRRKKRNKHGVEREKDRELPLCVGDEL